MIEKIVHNDELLSIIVRSDFNEPGIHFFTPDEFSQQLAFMHHPAGKIIQPHVHNPVKREVHYTKEILYIRKGKVRVDFYDDCKNYIKSRLLFQGDLILLSTGGHGFTVLEELEMFEIKQGPYAGELDKTRFDSISEQYITFK
jgi:mannose-6-phosphate isomerase-like protein (cupin superfamily)